MRGILGAAAVIAIIIAAHAIPALILTYVPAWILIPAAVIGFIALIRFVLWTIGQMLEADN